MKVRAGGTYFFSPTLFDRIRPSHCTQLVKEGDEVRVVNLPGCPRANTMGHCHIETVGGEFAGLVMTNSLHTKQDYIEYLRQKLAGMEQSCSANIASK